MDLDLALRPIAGLLREPLPTAPAAIEAESARIQTALYHINFVDAQVDAAIDAAGVRRDESLIYGDMETVQLAEQALAESSLQRERLTLLERRLHARLAAMQQTTKAAEQVLA